MRIFPEQRLSPLDWGLFYLRSMLRASRLFGIALGLDEVALLEPSALPVDAAAIYFIFSNTAI